MNGSAVPDEVLAAWPEVAEAARSAPPVPAEGGLINATWFVGGRWVLQRLHAIFAPEVHLDIAALTPRLRDAGLPVPALVPTADGRLWVDRRGVWRVLTRLPGAPPGADVTLAQVAAAGRVLARLHGALVGVEHRFAFGRLGIHDTPRHIAALAAALAAHPGHRLAAAARRLARALFAAFDASGSAPPLPARVGHGDPKLGNLLFEGDTITGVIDLDTFGWTTLDAELGDALRSWCGHVDEAAPDPRFDLGRYEAAVGAYLAEAAPWVTPEEIAALPGAAARIALELASRFLADALNESYFGWDPARAPTAGDHHLMRAEAQFALSRAVTAARPELEAITRRCARA
jgi:Ser/Thr protein kinase RdoA (MazF antagonist)